MRPAHFLLFAYFFFVALLSAPEGLVQAVFLFFVLTANLSALLLYLGDVIVLDFTERRATCEFRYRAICGGAA